jgi:hypothetical protein
MYPGDLYPYREPPPRIPKRHTVWLALALFGSLLLVLLGLMIGFWRAISAPMPTIETPSLETPLPPARPPSPKLHGS